MVKSVFFFLLLCSYTVVFSQQQIADLSGTGRSPLFKDSFDNNSNNWITDNSWVVGKVENGFYVLTSKNYKNQTGLSYKAIPVDYSRNFEIESEFTIHKGTGALLFAMSKDFDHYRIELSEKNNTINIVRDNTKTKKVEKIYTGKLTSYTSPGKSNKILIHKIGNQYSFFINEKQVSQISKIENEGDQIGFSVGINSEISIAYMNVSYLTAQPIIVSKQNDPVKVSDSQNVAPPLSESSGSILAVSPVITWTSPTAEKTMLQDFSSRVKAQVRSEVRLDKVVFYVNGVSVGESEFQPVTGEKGKYLVEKTINFNPGENSVYFIVTDEKLRAQRSDIRFFTNPDATKPVITWGVPAENNVIVENERLNIEVCVQTHSELKSIKVLVNGETMGGENVFKPSNIPGCNIKWQYPIILREGVANSIVVIAENIAGSNPSESRIIRYSREIAQKRIALVLGNANYNNKTPLKNPIQDANLMEATLKNLGFIVIKYIDLDLDKMREAIRDFSLKMKDYNVALFYYAGHGVQVNGKNFLIPIDAKLEKEDDCKWETFAVNDLMEEFEKNPKNINIAILDACRSNPFQSWVRGDSKGFTPLTNTSGTFISFATAPGSTAADGSTGNGLFTEELVNQMNIPQPISSVFMNTRINVWARSKETQRPQEWNDLNGEFYFVKPTLK